MRLSPSDIGHSLPLFKKAFEASSLILSTEHQSDNTETSTLYRLGDLIIVVTNLFTISTRAAELCRIRKIK